MAAVVCNPVNVDTDELRAAIDAEAKRNGWGASLWFQTTMEDPGHGAAAKALASHSNLLIVVGGDGTIRSAAEASHGSELPLAVIPTGTGNLLARNLKLPLNDVAQSVRTAFNGVDAQIDTARGSRCTGSCIARSAASARCKWRQRNDRLAQLRFAVPART